MKKPLVIEYYTDILCVWAWIAQRRINELKKTLGNNIELRYRYVDIFGDVNSKMETSWKTKGGIEGFAEHIRKSASDFEDATINSRIWKEVKPVTSANAHLILKAIEISYGKEKSIEAALQIRKAFFTRALDIGNMDILYNIINELSITQQRVNTIINSGAAVAELMNDYQNSKQLGIKGSPSYIIDGGRQTLYGNVGYRVLLANIRELLKQPSDEASWC